MKLLMGCDPLDLSGFSSAVQVGSLVSFLENDQEDVSKSARARGCGIDCEPSGLTEIIEWSSVELPYAIDFDTSLMKGWAVVPTN
jgi:hypothetical protein